MSDFYGDDFTAELKEYFLVNLIEGASHFEDLIDDKIWHRIAKDFSNQLSSWVIDAGTNEFIFFSEWLSTLQAAAAFDSKNELQKTLTAIKLYAEELRRQKTDSKELSQRFSLVAQSTQEILFLHCRSGNEEFAIPILNVVEISGDLPLYSLPQKRPGILGVIPYRGEALPVINLADFGFQQGEIHKKFLLICDCEGKRFSLQITATEELLSLSGADLQEMNSEKSPLAASVVKKFFIHKKRSVMILDPQQLVAG